MAYGHICLTPSHNIESFPKNFLQPFNKRYKSYKNIVNRFC